MGTDGDLKYWRDEQGVHYVPRALAGGDYSALPQTNLLSPSFFKHAFAVWGHFFAANLIIRFTFFPLQAKGAQK